jgi:hypothetical protein
VGRGACLSSNEHSRTLICPQQRQLSSLLLLLLPLLPLLLLLLPLLLPLLPPLLPPAPHARSTPTGLAAAAASAPA